MSFYKKTILPSLAKRDADLGGNVFKLFLRTYYLFNRMSERDRPLNIPAEYYKPEIDVLWRELQDLDATKTKNRDKAKLANIRLALEVMYTIDDGFPVSAYDILMGRKEILQERYRAIENSNSYTNTVTQSRRLLQLMQDYIWNQLMTKSQRTKYLESKKSPQELAEGTGLGAGASVSAPVSAPMPEAVPIVSPASNKVRQQQETLPSVLRSKKKEFPPMLAPQRKTRRARKLNIKTRRNRK